MRVRDKVISLDYDILNLPVYDTTLQEFRYKLNDHTEEIGDFRVYNKVTLKK